MFTALIVIVSIFGYIFLGGLSGAKYQAIKSQSCGRPNHWGPYSWCGHTCNAIWFMGVLWPLALPATAGIFIGSKDKKARFSRTERRRQNEIEEAKHQAELARYRRMEDEELDRQLRSVK